jgi:CO dehydrogenase/acetyl-CoA synthase beta subunit
MCDDDDDEIQALRIESRKKDEEREALTIESIRDYLHNAMHPPFKRKVEDQGDEEEEEEEKEDRNQSGADVR